MLVTPLSRYRKRHILYNISGRQWSFNHRKTNCNKMKIARFFVLFI
jgi:hypothetical protein